MTEEALTQVAQTETKSKAELDTIFFLNNYQKTEQKNRCIEIADGFADYQLCNNLIMLVLRGNAEDFDKQLFFIESLRQHFYEKGDEIQEFIAILYSKFLIMRQGVMRFTLKYQQPHFEEKYEKYLEFKKQGKFSIQAISLLENTFLLMFNQLGQREKATEIFQGLKDTIDSRIKQSNNRRGIINFALLEQEYVEEDDKNKTKDQLEKEKDYHDQEIKEAKQNRIRIFMNQHWYAKIQSIAEAEQIYMSFLVKQKENPGDIDIGAIESKISQIEQDNNQFLENIEDISEQVVEFIGMHEDKISQISVHISHKLKSVFSAENKFFNLILLVNAILSYKYEEADALSQGIMKMFMNIVLQHLFSKKLLIEIKKLLYQDDETKLEAIQSEIDEINNLANIINLDKLDTDTSPEGKYLKYMLGTIMGTATGGINYYFECAKKQKYQSEDLLQYALDNIEGFMLGNVENEAFYNFIMQNPNGIAPKQLLTLFLKSIQKVDSYYSKEEPWHSGRVAILSNTIYDILLKYPQAHTYDFMGGELKSINPDYMEIAALYHDAGKAMVPWDHLYCKGRLPKDYWLRIQDHTVNGLILIGEIAERYLSNKLPPELRNYIEQAMLKHHIRYDAGPTSYPQEYIKQYVPLFVRIISLADTIEAILGRRIYELLDYHRNIYYMIYEMIRCANTQFDPQIIAFVLDDMLQGTQKSAILKIISQTYNIQIQDDFFDLLKQIINGDINEQTAIQRLSEDFHVASRRFPNQDYESWQKQDTNQKIDFINKLIFLFTKVQNK